MIVAICLYSALVSWIEMDFLKLGADSQVKNVSVMHTMLTFVISTLLVFRINSAYERWWEGRKLWGSLVNSSRNLAIKLNALLPETAVEDRHFFSAAIPNYAFALVGHLQNEKDVSHFTDTSAYSRKDLNLHGHLPNQIASRIFKKAIDLNRSGALSGEQLLVVNAELTNFTDVCGACERIKNTPIPYSYSAFLKKFIFFFVMTLPISLVFSLGYYCIPVVAFLFYVLTSLELIAEEIEDPFGKDDNDLPTLTISKNIRKSVNEIFGFSQDAAA